MSADATRPLLAVSMGDPAGIGPEVIAKSLTVPSVRADADYVVVGDAEALRRALELAQLKAVVEPVASPGLARRASDARAIPVLEVGAVGAGWGWARPTLDSDRAQLAYIERAVAAIFEGAADGIVTGPISKASIARAGSPHPGHTEMLAALCEARDGVAREPVMMLAGEHLKVVPLTTHVPISAVPGLLSVERIAHGVRVTHRTLISYFGRRRPRIALAGLNPHAGEHGLFGDEEARLIEPAIRLTRAEGIEVAGPLPADTVFRRALEGEFDVVLGMYHDQALIPLKLLDFDRAVNVTLGLPLVRTSVDHGTAYDLAGKGVASAGSMIAAMRLAASMVRERRRESTTVERSGEPRA